MEKMLCTKSNKAVIIMTILHFFILVFMVINLILSKEFSLTIFYFYIFYVLFIWHLDILF